jgi:LmbE family N-acetylglucosaminyl deacetylase
VVWGLRNLVEAFAPDVTEEMDHRRCLVLAPHPDDEVLGCGGTIARKVRQGTHVSIAFLTDGRGGLAGSPEEVTSLREAEALRAAATLGLSPDRLTFLRFADGQLTEHVQDATIGVRRLVDALGVHDLFVPYRREFHADHIAAWQIGSACRRPGMRLFEYPIWYGPWLWRRLRGRARIAAVSQLSDARRAVKVSILPFVEVKKRALAAHQSQVRAFEAQGAWAREFLAAMNGRYELFFTCH